MDNFPTNTGTSKEKTSVTLVQAVPVTVVVLFLLLCLAVVVTFILWRVMRKSKGNNYHTTESLNENSESVDHPISTIEVCVYFNSIHLAIFTLLPLSESSLFTNV